MDDCCEREPLFTFGVIADIQYADIDDGLNFTQTRRRFYRNSLQLLREARETWSQSATRPNFILQLGDIIDGFNKDYGASSAALDRVLEEFNLDSMEVHHVWGNHELYNFTRSELLHSRLNSAVLADRSSSGTRAGGDIYAYSFSPFPGFTFVVLDAYDVSLLGVEEDSSRYHSALTLIKLHNNNEDLNCPPVEFDSLKQRFAKFNGGFSMTQLDWLNCVLSSADKKQEKVTSQSTRAPQPPSAWPGTSTSSCPSSSATAAWFVSLQDTITTVDITWMKAPECTT
ncbi:manganese-dependent ADP-ribose/CDP-alcohol diphosphatase isoform X3 [Dunckerocampus dactyliophorus]|uniref:manganese-dependent ADP-ribose/CDP-alcohol diphosphatase isoform X3 n=1 Tax=Dunckerocampus dactyliophorus TaxID=161453 RepID=UPI0024067796|nr:manganese-dependent ADP-ribose/CDP-alcohol diphosphatase isoform X3 [Dunckerocampus dactyliophorus]